MKKIIVSLCVLTVCFFAFANHSSLGVGISPFSVESSKVVNDSSDSKSSVYGFGARADYLYTIEKGALNWGFGGQFDICDFIYRDQLRNNNLNLSSFATAQLNFLEYDGGYIAVKGGPGFNLNICGSATKFSFAGMTEFNFVLHMYNGFSVDADIQFAFAKNIFNFRTFFGLRKTF